jgi:hypothetical protein
MMLEFCTLQFTREELEELRLALLQRAMVEDELRLEKGQEKADRHPLLDRVEALLADDQEKLKAIDQAVEDELWEFAWYAYTDEWAWYRAAQDVNADPAAAKLAEADKKTRIEKLYKNNFDRYVAEVDMREAPLKESRTANKQDHKKPSH